MSLVTSAARPAIHVSPERAARTGQPLVEAVDYGSVRVVRPGDQAVARRDLVGEAIRRRHRFSVRYRPQCRGGRSIWTLGGTVPSSGPPERSCPRLPVSTAQVPEVAPEAAQGGIGSFTRRTT